jgi:hypothetical protein
VADDPVGAFDLVRGLPARAPGPSLADGPLEAPSAGLDLPVPDLDLDLEGTVVLLVAVVAAAIAATALIVSAWLVWFAPSLLAELALDATLGAVLFRSLRGRTRSGEPWLAAMKHTWGPALVVTLTLVSGALVLEHAVPGARSLREVAHRVMAPATRTGRHDPRASR